MPCRDYYDDHPEKYFTDVTEPALKKQISFAESALCAALDALESFAKPAARGNETSLDLIDYAAAGITKKELLAWRKKHKELDKQHRAEELAKAKKSALAKLSDVERKALKELGLGDS